MADANDNTDTPVSENSNSDTQSSGRIAGDTGTQELRTSKPNTLLDFYRRINIGADCWEWQGRLSSGYGYMSYKGKTYHTHRLSYLINVADLIPGMEIDHLCRNRACVNPNHLEQVTSSENWRRGMFPSAINARKTHCLRGHELTEDNIYSYGNGRQCRKCHNRRVRECEKRKGIPAGHWYKGRSQALRKEVS